MGWLFKDRKKEEPKAPAPSNSIFSTDAPRGDQGAVLERALASTFQKPLPKPMRRGMAADALEVSEYYGGIENISYAQLAYFGSQGFLGYQVLAMLMQNWIIDKACTMPAKDAVRNGYEVTTNDAQTIPPAVFDLIRAADKRMKVDDNLVEFIRLGKGFGIRIALFVVESTDPLYYEKPFNIDGVGAGKYKGISQIDPMWISPEFSWRSLSDPAAMDFYEPTYWTISGKRYHRSHLKIYRANVVPDVLKPTYQYGGVSIPQKIFERVYAAERTANEAPMLAMTKRLNVLKTDVAAAMANEVEFTETMNWQTRQRDNYGVRVVGTDDVIEQHDTALNDLDEVIMTQFQLVAAAANVPATKLLGTTPKGFNSTGEYEEASYHEELESIQTSDLSPLLERHHALVIRSEVLEAFPELKPFETTVKWEPLDAMTAKEQAEVNKLEAETDSALVTAGAITGEEVRDRLIKDPNSGYTGIAAIEQPDDGTDPDGGDAPSLEDIVNEIAATVTA